MSYKSRKILYNYIAVFVLSALAVGLRVVSWGRPAIHGLTFFSILSIYFGMLGYWGVSVQRRIENPRIRHFLLNALWGVILWVIIRSIHNHITADDSVAERLTWYGYYACMMITLLSVFYMSLFIGKSKNHKASPICRLVDLVSAIIVLGIMTNDYHELCFGYKPNTSHAGHGPLYVACVIWFLFLIIASFTHITRSYEEKDMKKKVVWPISCFVLGIVFFAGYLIWDALGHKIIIELVLGFSIVLISTLESLIQTGLIPSNTDYEFCFSNSSLNMSILNKDGEAVFASSDACEINKDLFSVLLEKSSKLMENDTELFIDDIRGGYVVWERSIKDEIELIRELDSINGNLENANGILKKNIDLEGRRHRLEARNRLYDLVINRIDFQISEMERRLETAKNASPEAVRRLVGEINVIGAYIKRKSNLILVEELKSVDLGKELKLSFRETFDILNKIGIHADYLFREIPQINIDVALIMYDLLETVIENSISNMENLVAIVTDANFATSLTANVSLTKGIVKTEEELSKAFEGWITLLDENYAGRIAFEIDENEFSICMVIPKGGADIWNS